MLVGQRPAHPHEFAGENWREVPQLLHQSIALRVVGLQLVEGREVVGDLGLHFGEQFLAVPSGVALQRTRRA